MVCGSASAGEEKVAIHSPQAFGKEILGCYSEQFCGNTFENSYKMDKLFE